MELKPRLVLRAVRLSVETAEGQVGRTVFFQHGLNVLRAGNTSGKSTTVQAIIYALGLEGMLSPKREVPLPHSMTDSLTVEGKDRSVLASRVSLEFENAAGTIVTATRQVKNASVDNTVISVDFGPAITDPKGFPTTDFFVRRKGAAQRENGFHFFLCDFLGWELPLVSHMDGSEKPLYSECLFPFFYVEQKHGWSGLPPRIPTYLGIREVGKRSFEYVLGLEVFQRILLRQRLKSNITELEVTWRSALLELQTLARATGVTTRNEPRRISDSRGESSPVYTALVAGEWLPTDVAINQLRQELSNRARQEISTAEEGSQKLENELQSAEDSVRSTLVTLSLLMEERGVLEEQEGQLDLRLDALAEDLQRHKDSALLVRLGAKHVKSLAVDHACPTCHQEVNDGFDIASHAMTVDENITFIDRQRKTFFEAREDATRALQSIRLREKSLRNFLAEMRRRVRQIKDTLIGPSNAPSLADISERSALQDQLDRLINNEQALKSQSKQLRDLAFKHKEQSDLLAGLAKSDLSEADNQKLRHVEHHLRRQLHRYQFDSLNPQDVEINRETYRPSHEGYELGFDLSASDMIRVIWSYLLAVLRVGDDTGGNHLGLLILDEPKQQETADESYRELLHEAAEQGQRGSQIIIATSENRDSLIAMLAEKRYNLIDIPEGEKILAPVQP